MKKASDRNRPGVARDTIVALLAAGASARREGDSEQAEQAFRRVLAKQPKHPEALHLLGLVLCSRGDLSGAQQSITEATRLAPEVAVYHANLGRVLGEAGDIDGSVAALERAVALDQSLLGAVYNLGLAHEAKGALLEAEQHYRWAAEGETALPEASFNLGNLLLADGRLEAAVQAYTRAIELRPGYTRALANLALGYQRLGKLGQAAQAYEQLLAEEPEDPEALHMLAALTGENRERAEAGYVTRFFDDYAARFERVLVGELGYDLPASLSRLVGRHLPASGRFARALDLGCGTGLCGRALKHLCETIVGVDLSPKMLEQARAAGGYDELHRADLISFLSVERAPFELTVAADVLIYVGDLQRTFELVAARGRPSGLFAFSTEAAPAGRFQLERTGRFCHSRPYVEATAFGAGFEILACEDKVLRLERGAPVNGHLFLLRAPATA